MDTRDSYRNSIDDDEEMIGLLMAISVTSKHLARELIRETCAGQSKKGANHGQNERNGTDHRRPAECRRCY